MKLSALFTASIVALTGLGNIASAKSLCAKKERPPWAWRWEIHIDEVEDVQDTCECLWKGLEAHGKFCRVDNPRGCGTSNYYKNEKALHMWFKTKELCDDALVAKAFYNATGNAYGAIDCTLEEEDWMFDPEEAAIDSA